MSGDLVRDDVLKPYVNELDVTKWLTRAPRRTRVWAFAAFLAQFAFLAPYCRRYAWMLCATLGVPVDALAAKTVRALVRTAALEDAVWLAPVMSGIMVGALPAQTVLLSFLPFIAVEGLLLLCVLLVAEQVAKGLFCVVVVFVPDEPSPTLRPVIVPAWQRQLMLLSRAPICAFDWLRLALGAEQRWADVRAGGQLELLVPREELTSAQPFFRRALRRRYNDAHSILCLPKSARLRTALVGVLVALGTACAPSELDAWLALTSGGGSSLTVSPLSLGADVVPHARVFPLTSLLQALDVAADTFQPTSRHAWRDKQGKALPRAYATVRGDRIVLEVDSQVWERTGLWYGAEVATPFGTAAVVGVDAANQLWLAHDFHLLTRADVPVVSYGVFQSVSELAKQGVHVLEDPQLLGVRAAGPGADNVVVQAAHDDPLVAQALEILATMKGGTQDEIVTQMEQLLGAGVKVVHVDLDAQRAAQQVRAEAAADDEADEADALEEDDFIDEIAKPPHKRRLVHAEVE
jgi:hypothetical protein